MANFGRGNDERNYSVDLSTSEASQQVHFRDDTDSSPRAHHHTLGTGVNQSFPGNRGSALELKVSLMVPVGAIFMWPSLVLPDKCFSMVGQSLVRNDYPDLFAILGTDYGAVDANHFNLPDMRGRFPIGIMATAVGTPAAKPGYTEVANGVGAAPGFADINRLSHRHTHTNDNAVLNQQTNTTTGGSAQRLTNPTNHSHGMDQQGLGGTNLDYHGFLALSFVIRVLP